MSDYKCKYYKDSANVHNKVNYCYLDKDGVAFGKYQKHPCFSTITYSAIPANAHRILIFHRKNEIPYDFDTIKRWIKEINELGFPCSVEVDKYDQNIYNFFIDLKDYKFKMHVSCTLQLIRCLFEKYICFVPEFYLKIIESNKKTDKFLALQDAHRELSEYAASSYFNSNHTITCKENGKINIGREELFENIANTKYEVYSSDYCSLSRLWRGKKD